MKKNRGLGKNEEAVRLFDEAVAMENSNWTPNAVLQKFETAARLGHVVAMRYTGYYYQHVFNDTSLGIYWTTCAAKAGDAPAQNTLVAYYAGSVFVSEITKSLKWALRCNDKLPETYEIMVQLYLLCGDFIEAMYWERLRIEKHVSESTRPACFSGNVIKFFTRDGHPFSVHVNPLFELGRLPLCVTFPSSKDCSILSFARNIHAQCCSRVKDAATCTILCLRALNVCRDVRGVILKHLYATRKDALGWGITEPQ